MTVTELLKGKKAYQKEYMLDEKDLDTAVVDRLANDSAQVVRKQAIRHPNVSQAALYKFLTHKKNRKLEFALSVAMRQLSSELKIKFIESGEYLNVYFDENLGGDLVHTIGKSFKPKLLEVFATALLNQNNYYIAKYLSIYYKHDTNPKLFSHLRKHYPEMLIKFRDENKLSKKLTDAIFNEYIASSSSWVRLYSDLGWSFLEDEMSKKQLDTLFKKFNDFESDTLESLVKNKNFNDTHALRLLESGNDSPKQTKYLIEKLTLNSKLEKRIEELVTETTTSWGRESNWNYDYFELWANNPTQSKAPILRLMKMKEKEDNLSTAALVGMVKSGKYKPEEIEGLIKDDEYYEVSTYMELVKEKNFSQPKLRKLWEQYYKGKWNSEEIEGPNYSGRFDGWNMNFDKARMHEFVYNMIKLSSLAPEFSMEYATIHKDDKYIPEDAKEMFLF